MKTTRTFAAIVAIITAWTMVGCSPVPTDVALKSAVLTPDGEAYSVIAANGALTVQTNEVTRNNREIYWEANASVSPSATQCSTWESGHDITQNGLAFRISETADGVNAIVFERNIWAYAFWVFTPVMFHTGSDYDQPFDSGHGIGVDLSGYLGTGAEPVWPLRVCASLSTGGEMRFAVAKSGDYMPPLSNPGKQGGVMQIDVSKFYHPGDGETGQNGGVYVAHLQQGNTAVVSGNVLDGKPSVTH